MSAGLVPTPAAHAAPWEAIPGPAPTARDGFAAAAVPSGGVLLGGGSRGLDGAVADMWRLSDEATPLWSDVSDAADPAARSGHALIGTADEVLLFGGQTFDMGAAQPVADTWLWDGGWRVTGEAGPAARSQHAMAYDSVRDRVVLFGGVVAVGAPDDETWEWDVERERWERVDVASPGARRGHAMTFDGSQVVLFGGLADGYLGDTWTYDGSEWTEVALDGPAARSRHAMASDEEGHTLLYGGLSDAGVFEDSWVWFEHQWAPLRDEAPGKRFGHALVWDRDHLVLWGGSTPAPDDGTWIYTPDWQAQEPGGETGSGEEGGSESTSGDSESGEPDAPEEASTGADPSTGDDTGDTTSGANEGGGCGCRGTAPTHIGWAALLLGVPRRRRPRPASTQSLNREGQDV